MPLYQFQAKLPRLPVPPLEETCAKYLKSVRPLVSDEEYAVTASNVREFIRPGGLGHELQQRLVDYKNANPNSSWLVEWWNKNGYLRVRCPNVMFVSYFFHFVDSPLAWARSQTGRSAALLCASMKFRDLIFSGQLNAEQIGKKKTPLCSTPFKYLFNACRIPFVGEDTLRMYDPTVNTHMAVVCNNKFFTFDMRPNGEDLSVGDVNRQLMAIVAQAGSKESPIGLLSSQDRDLWAADRELLLRAGNEQALERVQSAVLLLCLDDSSPTSKEEMSRVMWHGDGANRLYDKSVQLVVCRNGKAGLMGEHSLADGMPMVLYADALMAAQRADTESNAPAPPPSQRFLATPTKVEFCFTPAILSSVARAEEAFRALVAEHDVRVLTFHGYGKNTIKTFGVSPDAFAQMAIQLMYFKFFGVCRGTYESTQVRPFLHGRTEVTRSVSSESKAFVEAMSDQPGIPTDRKRELLKAAAVAHTNYIRDAAQARGVDRHLLGLKLRLREGEASRAPIFSDVAFSRSSTWHISTSTLSHPMFDGWGWGEVVPDGVGVAYSVKDDSMQFNIASMRHALQPSWPTALVACMEEALVEMKQLFDAAPRSKL